MRSFLAALFVVPVLIVSAAYGAEWQVGRIQDVKKDVTQRVLYYVVNTPVTEQIVTYTISVHAKDQILTAFYDLDKAQSEPPSEWTENAPVWIDVQDKTVYLKSPTSGQLKLTLAKRKAAPMMRPLSVEEIKTLNAGAKLDPANSTVGFGAKEAAQAQEATAPKPEPVPPGGTVSISTVPYLADIFVDGKDMGYSPAKIRMSPGKHDIRVSKNGYIPFTRQVMVAADTEQSLDVTLDKKP